MIKIGMWEVIFSKCLILPQGESATVDFNEDGWNLKFEIVFTETDEEPNISRKLRDDSLKLILNKWTSGLGASVENPIELATRTTTGEILAVMLTNYNIGGTNKLDVQLMQKGGPRG